MASRTPPPTDPQTTLLRTADSPRTAEPQPTPDDARPFLGLSVAQIAAGAGAAATSAFAASRIGVGGTLAGAAVGSVVSTVAAAAYGHSITSARRRLRRIPTVVRTVPQGSENAAGRVPGPAEVIAVDDATASQERAALGEPTLGEPALGESTAVQLTLEQTEGSSTSFFSPVRRFGGVKALATGAVVVFLLAMAVITVLELGLGRPVSDSGSGGDGGTSVGRLIGGSQSEPTPTPTPTDPTPTGPTPTELPSPTSSTQPSPTQEATPTSEPSESAPPEESSPTPVQPTEPAATPVP